MIKMILVDTDVEAEGMYAAILPQSYEMGEAVAEAVIADYGAMDYYRRRYKEQIKALL